MRILAALGFFLLSLTAHADIIGLDPQGLQQLMAKGVPLVDVRTQKEWRQTGIIKGAHLLTFFDEQGHYDISAWMAKFSKIAGKNDPVILVCRTGHRTHEIGQFLNEKMGYKRVYELRGGITHWIQTGHKTVPPPR